MFMWPEVISGVVEGLTEFLPISSTAHLMILKPWVASDVVVVQLGAVMAAMLYYKNNIWWLLKEGLNGKREAIYAIINLFIAFIPVIFLAPLLHGIFPGSKHVMSWSLGVGGLVIILVNFFVKKANIETCTVPAICRVRWWQAILIGLGQVIAVIPGVSRSGATIVMGLLCGLDRRTAIDFSFILALPTMFAAVVYSLFKDGSYISGGVVLSLTVAFATAAIAIRPCINFISTQRGLFYIGCYRIALAMFLYHF